MSWFIQTEHSFYLFFIKPYAKLKNTKKYEYKGRQEALYKKIWSLVVFKITDKKIF